LTSANLFVEQMWLAVYNTISSANHIIANVDNVTGIDKAEQNDIKGEALFVRAFCHFDALRTWGEHWNLSSEYGIPVVTKVQTPKDVIARSTVAASYEAILSDLTAAAGLVSDKDATTTTFKGQGYITLKAVNALLARVYLYKGDKTLAGKYADVLIKDNTFALFDATKFSEVYTGRLTTESILELIFDSQNRSAYNSLTYSRPEALRTEVQFLMNTSVDTFFLNRPKDVRSQLANFTSNDPSIQPDGRTEKYRGEEKRDNPAYLIRLAEMYLIAAEAKGKNSGLADLNTLRTARGMDAITGNLTDEKYAQLIANERRAELNMEGHRYTDLARTKEISTVLGKNVIGAFPIPLREIGATNGVLKQFPGY
jgi:starch-binding outer membrane protein, SusD/RagB family